MKISKSKQELARIISENGGWRDGAEWAAMDKTDGNCNDNAVGFFSGELRPECFGKIKMWRCRHIETVFMGYEKSIFAKKIIGNWHQSCLSHAEYLHLYPAQDASGWIEWKGGAANPVEFGVLVDVKLANGEALNRVSANSGAEWRHCWGDTNIIAYRLHKPEQAKPEFCESVMGSIPEPDEQVWTNPPSIEQLAADYRNAKDYAERKQQEADDAKADANEALRKLEIAGEAIGLIVTPITAKKEDELVIEVKVDDEVECVESNIKRDKYNGMVGRLRTIDESDTSTPYLVDFGGEEKIWCHKVKFIRRP